MRKKCQIWSHHPFGNHRSGINSVAFVGFNVNPIKVVLRAEPLGPGPQTSIVDPLKPKSNSHPAAVSPVPIKEASSSSLTVNWFTEAEHADGARGAPMLRGTKYLTTRNPIKKKNANGRPSPPVDRRAFNSLAKNYRFGLQSSEYPIYTVCFLIDSKSKVIFWKYSFFWSDYTCPTFFPFNK